MIKYFSQFKVVVGALLIIFTWAGCGGSGSERADTFLIRIGDRVVTAIDFNEAFEVMKAAGLHNSKQDPNAYREARLRLLNQMIEEMILLGRAKELGIQISDAEFENAILEFKKDYPEGVFEETLLENAVSYNYWEKRLKIRLFMEKVIAKEFGERIKITPEDISKYYQEYARHREEASDSEEESELKERAAYTEEMVVRHLRWKKTEEAYQSWIKKIKQKQTIEINQAKWQEIINS
ncbi:SurA N-terminal domain-containing protein [Thermodesulfobacteriota bacterium]